MLTQKDLDQLFAQPYPYLAVKGDKAALHQAKDLVLPVPAPRLPLALALQYPGLDRVQQRDLLLALAKREQHQLQPRDIEDLERALQAAPLAPSSEP